jgi:hypothetical protein
MYLRKVISRKTWKKLFFVGVLKVKDENSRIRMSQRHGSGSVPKCPGSATLLGTMAKTLIFSTIISARAFLKIRLFVPQLDANSSCPEKNLVAPAHLAAGQQIQGVT